jgi:pimeloyl-ACP methyl ester carboxylesterase
VPLWILAAWLLAAACTREDSSAGPPAAGGGAPSANVSAPLLPPGPDKKCVVLLHGKGGGALPGSVVGDVEYLRPAGNGTGWGGREWRYFPDDRFEQMQTSIAGVIESAGCGRVVVQGFSNGASAAAKLYCRGETFDGRVRGFLLDDPVPDQGVVGCRPSREVPVRLYWTGGLAIATDGWSCASQDWTCEGGRTIGIERYARELETEVARSIHTTHMEYDSPPEVVAWLQ